MNVAGKKKELRMRVKTEKERKDYLALAKFLMTKQMHMNV